LLHKNTATKNVTQFIVTLELRINLAWIVEHDVLPCELEQHGIVEELVDGDVLRETFSPPAKDSSFLTL
jgi:hypothetical protein